MISREILTEAAKRTMQQLTEAQEPKLSRRLQKLLDKITEVANEIGDSYCIDTTSTWQIPYIATWSAKPYRGTMLLVKREEMEEPYWTVGGRQVKATPKFEKWIVTDRNYDSVVKDGDLLYQLRVDYRGYKKFNN